jgi:hypothetical protein
MTLAPEIKGVVGIRSAPAEFLQAFQHRVTSGLLSGMPRARSNYIVTKAGGQQLTVRAADWPTAIAIGLNEVELQVPEKGVVRYRVRYWRWASYVIGLGAVLGLIGLALLLTLDVRGYIAQSPTHRLPGLSADQNLVFAWAMVLFWGFLWPWLLILLHQRPLRGVMQRLIAEVDTEGSLV